MTLRGRCGSRHSSSPRAVCSPASRRQSSTDRSRRRRPQSPARPVDVSLSVWHGVTPALLLSVLTLAAVGFAYVVHAAVRTRTWKPRHGTEDVYDGALSALNAVSRTIAPALHSASLRTYVMVIVATTVLVGGAALVTAPGSGFRRAAHQHHRPTTSSSSSSSSPVRLRRPSRDRRCRRSSRSGRSATASP